MGLSEVYVLAQYLLLLAGKRMQQKEAFHRNTDTVPRINEGKKEK